MAIGHDPGLTLPIFEADFSEDRWSADCRYRIPRGFYVALDVSCKTSFSSSTMISSNQYSENLQSSVDAGIGIPILNLIFRASKEFKKRTIYLDSGKSVFVNSGAECNSYFSKINPQQPPKVRTSQTHNSIYRFPNLLFEKKCVSLR